MNNTLSKIIIFTAGAAIGSVVTWKLVKDKYEQIAREEIKSIRDFYFSSENSEDPEKENDGSDFIEDKKDFDKIVKDAGYLMPQGSETSNKSIDKKEEDDDMEPYVIPPEEFDENDYETVSLYYFEDGTLQNAITNEVIDDPEELVGSDFMYHFGEYEADSVYIRNDALETDFEILRG